MPRTPPEDWPNRAHSRLIDCRPHRWHVQVAGSGPTLLLLHGAGAATQSWRGLLPLLAEDHHVVAPDLPGQGFTAAGARGRAGLDAMAEDLVALCAQEGWQPAAIIGHSAGAAIALRMAELLPQPPQVVIGLNAALAHFKGVAGWLFPAMAKLLALNPLTPALFTWLSGSERRVRELLDSTGSRVDTQMVQLYHRLATNKTHVDGTLAMMAAWKLDGLLARLPDLAHPVCLIVGAGDRTVPPETSRRAAARLPDARYIELPGLGHLAHEEAPDRVAAAIRECLSGRGVEAI